MRYDAVILTLGILIFTLSCSKSIDYSQETIASTSGRYLYTPDEVIDVYYTDNQLFLKWKGDDAYKPVALDETTFFIPDMYKKLRFVKHPETQKRYLGIVSEDDDTQFTYDYVKVADSFKTPSMYLKAENYKAAQAGFLKIKAQDSAHLYVDERQFNRLGYDHLRKQEYDKAIAVFTMNVALFPESDNVYDSLADAYLRRGDSAQAYTHYKKALELNTGNDRAKAFVKAYQETHMDE